VLVVTHLAQVAAAASTHVHVVKTVERGVTIATASVLDDAGRVDEVARMLAGDTSGAARRHAAELLATHGSATPARRAR
jgi:DNA repair protein RecN (Recombination protein N)